MRLCIHPCLFVSISVCLSVIMITQKVMDGFREVAHHLQLTIPFNFGGDPDMLSGLWIQHMCFLKSVIAG